MLWRPFVACSIKKACRTTVKTSDSAGFITWNLVCCHYPARKRFWGGYLCQCIIDANLKNTFNALKNRVFYFYCQRPKDGPGQKACTVFATEVPLLVHSP
jgi:hypothetical protein